MNRSREEIEHALDDMAKHMAERWKSRFDQLAFVGILRGGVPLARVLAVNLASHTGEHPPQVGELDISLYRDDAGAPCKIPRIQGTHIPFDIHGKSIVLVDDILHTGRTVRAAIDLLMDFGRPAQIELAVLADRGGRQLPIQPDYCAYTSQESDDLHLKLRFDESGTPERLHSVV